MLEDFRTAMKKVGADKYLEPKWTKVFECNEMYLEPQ
jgi:hypothetical protein